MPAPWMEQYFDCYLWLRTIHPNELSFAEIRECWEIMGGGDLKFFTKAIILISANLSLVPVTEPGE